MIDPSDLATGVVGGLIQDKLKGAISDAISKHEPSIHHLLQQIVDELKELNAYTSPTESPDIIDYFNASSGSNMYTISDTYARSHILIFNPIGTTLTASIVGMGQSLPFAIARGWTTLDFPVGTSFTLATNAMNLIVYANVTRGAWLS